MLYPVKTRFMWCFLFLFVAALVACTKTQESYHSVAPPPVPQQTTTVTLEHSPGLAALTVARDQLGTPYRYGGTSPSGFDCSGLVQYSYAQAGIVVPRTSQALFRSSERISLTNLQPGDLVFFHISQQKISHVGIYDGRDRFIHSPSSGKGVSYASLENPYWRERLVGVGRF